VSALNGAGEGGTNIGANQTKAAIPKTAIVVTHSGADTLYSDMPTAAAAMQAGDTMDIRDFAGPLLWVPIIPRSMVARPGARSSARQPPRPRS